MKIKLLQFLSVLFFSFINYSIAQTLPNPGFENWTTDSKSFLDPVGWTSTNLNYTLQSVDRSTGHSGSYAVHLNKISESSGPFGAAGGQIEYTSGLVNYRPTQISGYWKGNFNSGTDFVQVMVYMYDSLHNYINNVYVNTAPAATLSNWTYFTLALPYPTSMTNCYYYVKIYYACLNGVLGSFYADVDDLNMTVVTGIGELETIDLMHSFSLITKQPYKEYALKVDLLKNADLKIDLINIEGKIVQSTKKHYDTGHFEVPLNLTDVANGVYTCSIQCGNNSRQFKLIKNGE